MYESVDESAVQRPRIWPAILAFILVPPVGLVSFYFYKCAHDHIDSRRLGYIDPGFLSQGAVDRGRRFVVNPEKSFKYFPGAERGFYTSVKVAIAIFSSFVGYYPHLYIQSWIITWHSTIINGTGRVLTDQLIMGPHCGRSAAGGASFGL